MSLLEARLNILTTDNEMIKEILGVIAENINKAVRKAIPQFKPAVSPLVSTLIQASPEYQALLSGRLKDELGLTTPDVALSAIVKAIIDSITIEYTDAKISGDVITGSLTLSLLRTDYSDIIPLQDLAGTPIPWLQWLLTAGDSIVVANYNVGLRQGSSASRAGSVIMIPSGQGYRVPPEFAGTENNNWLTRSLIGIEPEIGNIMENEINRQF
jgi:hypothetical protein